MNESDPKTKRRPYLPPVVELVDLAVRGDRQRQAVWNSLREGLQAQTPTATSCVESTCVFTGQ